MARTPKPVPTVRSTLYLPQDLHARLTMLLFSEIEGRIPHGDWSEWIALAIRSRLDQTKENAPCEAITQALRS